MSKRASWMSRPSKRSFLASKGSKASMHTFEPSSAPGSTGGGGGGGADTPPGGLMSGLALSRASSVAAGAVCFNGLRVRMGITTGKAGGVPVLQ